MRGHKRERRPGVWELIYYCGRDPISEKPIYKSKTFYGGSRDADNELIRLIAEQNSKGGKPGARASLDFVIGKWLELQEMSGLSPTTLQGYFSIRKKWITPGLGKIGLDALTAADVRHLHAHMRSEGASDSRIRQAHAVVRGALRYAVQYEWVDRNVAANVNPPRQPRSEEKSPTPEQVNALWEAAGANGSALATCIALASLLGARLGELCALRWSDIDLDGGAVRFERSVYAVGRQMRQRPAWLAPVGLKKTKTHATGTVAADPVCVERLRLRKGWQLMYADRVGVELVVDPYVLSVVSNGSGPPRPDYYTKAFAKLRDGLNMSEFHLHSLRHFHVTYLAEAGVDLVTIARRVRHADTSMVGRVYAHALPAKDREAAVLLGNAVSSRLEESKYPRKLKAGRKSAPSPSERAGSRRQP